MTTILPLIDYLIITPLCAINTTQSSWGYNLNFTNNLTPKMMTAKTMTTREVANRLAALSLAKSMSDKQTIQIKLDAL